MTRRGSLEVGRGSGIRTHAWSKRTLGVGGSSRESLEEALAVERETKEGERGMDADMMAVWREEEARVLSGAGTYSLRLASGHRDAPIFPLLPFPSSHHP